MLTIKYLDAFGGITNSLQPWSEVSMQITKYMFIHVIKIFIFYMVSTIACVSINAYTNIPWFTFLKGTLAKVQLCVLIPKYLIEFSICCVKEVFDVGFTFSRTFSKL